MLIFLKIWIKTENALAKCNEEVEKNVIKALAVIYMIGEIEILVPDDLTIQTSLSLDKNIYEKTINKLIGGY